MITFFSNFFNKKDTNSTQLQTSLNQKGRECRNTFNLSEYLDLQKVSGVAKYNSIKGYLFKTFIDNNSVEKYNLNSYNPVGVELNKLETSQGVQLDKLEKSQAKKRISLIKTVNSQVHSKDLRKFDGSFTGFKRQLKKQKKSNFNLLSLSSQLYLYSLRNKISYLLELENAQEEENKLIKTNDVISDHQDKKKIQKDKNIQKLIKTKDLISDHLDQNIQELNKKISKTNLDDKVWKKPSFDTNKEEFFKSNE